MSVLSQIVSVIAAPVKLLTIGVTKVVPGFRKFAQGSLPMRVAVMAFFFLLIVLGTGVLVYFLKPPEEVQQRDWLRWGLLPLLLMLAIPTLVYWLVKLLGEKPLAPYSDLDRAWQLGIDALSDQQIPIRSVPLFVILGTDSAQQVRHLMDAAQIETTVSPPAGQDLPLLWYANAEAIFLFINGCSTLSKLSAKRHETSPTGPPQVAFAASDPAVMRTIDASAGPVGLRPAFTPVLPSAPSPVMPAAPEARGTITLSAPPTGVVGLPNVVTESRRGDPVAWKLHADELASQSRRLGYVCDLLRAARRPVCGLNGLLVVTPFELVESGSPQAQLALQTDLETLRDRLAVRCAATLVVSELERVDGFLELVKRVGDENVRDGRFGKGCSVWGDPREDRLDGVAAHAVGTFEDWIYRLFQDGDALRRRYNNKLVSLLCRTRGPFATALRDYVRKGFGYDPASAPELARSQFLFTGCYFAATGADADCQAFIKSVFAKMIENQDELQWAPQARQEERGWQIWGNIIALIGMAAIAAIVVGLLWP